mgnify:FL=1
MKKTIEQALQELATVRQWEMGKMVEVFGQCTVADLKEYVGFLTISTTGFKKADWVKQAVAKLSDEKFQAEAEAIAARLEQQRKETATKLADDLSIAYTKKATLEELVKMVEDKACLNMDIGCIDNVVQRLYSAKCEADRLYILAEFSMKFTAKMYYMAFGKKPSCYAKKVKNHRLGTFIIMDWEIDFANTEFQPAVWLENCDERLTELNNELATTEWQLTRCKETNREYQAADFLSRKSEFQDEVRFYETWRKALVKSA